MKCKKIFALLLSLCMIASSFVAMPVSAATENVIDIDLPLDAASELTWVASSSVTVTEADGIGGRDDVLKAEGLADSNNNTAGVKLPDGFAFQDGDILTYSVDVYCESAINPDIWLRNHGSALTPFITFYNSAITANTWTTVTKTVTFAELGTTYDWTTAGNYALYIRPRSSATVYVDNFTVTVSRAGYEEPHEHAYDDGTVTTAATCTEDGVKTFTCECGDTYTEAIAATGHAYDDGVVTKEATHIEAGVKTFTCGNCGDTYTEEIPANTDAHEYDEGVVTKEPTATEDGVKTYTCICGATYTEAIPATGDTGEPSTGGTTTGGTSTGGGTTDDGEVDDPCGTDHTWDEGVITIEPTTETEGVMTYTCTVCGETYTEAILVLDLGDLDGDEEIGTKDVIAFRRWLTGGYGVRIFTAAADVFKDGKLDAKDVITIRRFIVGGYGVVLQ